MDLVSRAFLGVHLVCAVTASREMFLQVLGGDESLATLAALVARLQQVNLWLHMSVQVWLCHPFVVAQSAAILTNTWSGHIANAQSSGKQELIKGSPNHFLLTTFSDLQVDQGCWYKTESPHAASPEIKYHHTQFELLHWNSLQINAYQWQSLYKYDMRNDMAWNNLTLISLLKHTVIEHCRALTLSKVWSKPTDCWSYAW